MKTYITEEQLRKYTNEISRILLQLTDDRIAEIAIIMNRWQYPDEFKDIYPYCDLNSNDTHKVNFLFWKICDDLIRKIIPETLIRKTLYRSNLMTKSDWDFSFDAVYDIEKETITYE